MKRTVISLCGNRFAYFGGSSAFVDLVIAVYGIKDGTKFLERIITNDGL